MENTLKRVGVIGGVRIPFCRNNTAYADVGNFGMSVKVLGSLVERFGLHGVELGEVAMGAVIKHSSDWNLAREAMLSSGLAADDAGHHHGARLRHLARQRDHHRQQDRHRPDRGRHRRRFGHDERCADRARSNACAAPARGQSRASRGRTSCAAATQGFSFSELKPAFPGVAEPRTGMSMGDHCELMAQGMAYRPRRRRTSWRWKATRSSRQRTRRGFFEDLVVPFRGLKRDGFLRPDTTLEKLAALKPAFDKTSGHGTLTAGNSTGLSDGAAAVLLASDDWADQRGLKIQAYFRDAEVAAVDFVARRRSADGADGRRAAHARAPD